MNKKIVSFLLVLSMLMSMFLMAIPASANTTTTTTEKSYVSKGYILAVHASNTANGMSIVYLLSDGTFIIYDGGTSTTDAKHLNEQLHTIAAEHGIEKVVVSLWVVTHAHDDHFKFIYQWGPYAANVQVKEFWFNNINNSDFENQIKKLYPNTPVNRVHAGETYTYADCELLVLYAADDTTKSYFSGSSANFTDLYGTNSGKGLNDFNQSSYIIKMTFEQKSILMTGDAGWCNFEHVYNSDLRDELDADIFQVPHHGVGSASGATGNRAGTPNNKHMAVVSPEAIIVPSGLNVTNMVLGGSRAFKDPVQQPDGTMAYDGMYRLYLDFGIVDAAGGLGKTFTSQEHHNSNCTDGEKYWIACWLDPNNYEGSKRAQCFFENVDPTLSENTPAMNEGAMIRADVDAGLEGSGIRFTSTVSAEVAEKLNAMVTANEIKGYSFGTVIFQESSLEKLGAKAVTAVNLKNAGEIYADVPAVNGISELKDSNGKTYYEFRAAIVNIKKANYDKLLCAISYIEFTLNSGATIRYYGDFDPENYVSAEYTAFQCITDLMSTSGVADGYNYCHQVNVTYQNTGNKYGKYKEVALSSPMYCAYSEAQRAILLEYMNG